MISYAPVFVVSRRCDMKTKSVEVGALGKDLNTHDLLVEPFD
jgi:hypothetical protein